MIIEGYHGTTVEAAHNIVREKYVRESEGVYEWLGRGSYFWVDAPYRAYKWAQKWACRNGGEAAVVKVLIEVDDIQVLDLTDIYFNQQIKDFALTLPTETIASNAQNPAVVQDINGKSQTLLNRIYHNRSLWPGYNTLDCKILNSYIEKFDQTEGVPEISLVKGCFLEGREIQENSFIFDHSHIQIAVRDSEIVKDISIYDMPPFSELQGEVINRWPVSVRPTSAI